MPNRNVVSLMASTTAMMQSRTRESSPMNDTVKLHRLRRHADGRVTYDDSHSMAGFLFLSIGTVVAGIGLGVLLPMWAGTTSLRGHHFDAIDVPVMAIPALGFMLTICGGIVAFRRRQLIFAPSKQEVLIVSSGLGWRETLAFRYDQIRAEMRGVNDSRTGRSRLAWVRPQVALARRHDDPL